MALCIYLELRALTFVRVRSECTIKVFFHIVRHERVPSRSTAPSRAWENTRRRQFSAVLTRRNVYYRCLVTRYPALPYSALSLRRVASQRCTRVSDGRFQPLLISQLFSRAQANSSRILTPRAHHPHMEADIELTLAFGLKHVKLYKES